MRARNSVRRNHVTFHPTWDFILKAVGRVIFSLLLAMIGSLILLRFLPRLPFGKRLILETDLAAGEG